MIGGGGSGEQMRALVRAQWQAIRNFTFKPGQRLGSVFMLIWYVLWYGAWAFGSYILFDLASDAGSPVVTKHLPAILLGMFGYWQLIPLMLVGTGLSLDTRKLRVYPIPTSALFRMEAMLRLTTVPEILLVTLALCLGLPLNPALPWWTFLPLVVFTVLNLAVSAGIRDLFTRLMGRKGTRELMILLLVLISAAPQVLLLYRDDLPFGNLLQPSRWTEFLPWGAAAQLAGGEPSALAAALLIGWTALAWWFGRMQFERSLRFDEAAARAKDRAQAEWRSPGERLATAVASLFRDPLSGLVWKEILMLSRSPRFRLVFIMGFSFGLLIFLPLVAGRETMQENYLTMVTAYSIMLLGEICFWNSFGIDRLAAQAYFVMPVGVRAGLVAKNIAGAFFVLLEVTIVAIVCAVLRFPVTLYNVVEAFAVAIVVMIFMLGCGNILSVRFPRAINPTQSWKGGHPGRSQAYLLLLYPAISAPVLLAYGARYAFDDSDLAFYAVLGVDLIVGGIFYVIALDSATAIAHNVREQFLEGLSSGSGPTGT